MKFSVLMSIYYKEKADYFNRAMKSIWDEQTLKPNEIVLVEDGKLTNELYKIIEKWKDKLDNKLKIVKLEKNVGLGDALNIGLRNCTNEIVARMDTDDISMPNRFEKQLKVLKEQNVDICSSWVSEFENDENITIALRKVPKTMKEIKKFAKKRNPLNHPAVIYKKESLLLAGGYKKMPLFEDYYLWARMLISGAQFYNIQEPLVNMRAGYSQLERRSGYKYALKEYKFQKELFNIGFLNKKEFIINLVTRLPIRVVPKQIVKLVYKLLRD